MKSFDGQFQQWDSYTLTSDSAAPFDRWWLVNTPLIGTHVFIVTPHIPSEAQFVKELSGLVFLNSEGNADLSSGIGALAVYRINSGDIYAEEVFTESERLIFHGFPYLD